MTSFVGKYPPYPWSTHTNGIWMLGGCHHGDILMLAKPPCPDTSSGSYQGSSIAGPLRNTILPDVTWYTGVLVMTFPAWESRVRMLEKNKNKTNLKSECVTSPSSLVVTRCMWRLVSSFFHAMQPLRDSARTTAIRRGQGRRAPTRERGEAHGGSVSLPQGLPLIRIFYKGHLKPTGPWLLYSSYM